MFGAATIEFEAELQVGSTRAAVAHVLVPEGMEQFIPRRERLCFDVSLTPRSEVWSGAFPQSWPGGRFEPLGGVYVIPPGNDFVLRAPPGRHTSFLCDIDGELLTQWFEGELRWTEAKLDACVDVAERRMRGLLLRLISEVRKPRFASGMLIELISVQLAIEFGRFLAPTELFAKGGLATWRKRLIEERVRQPGKAPLTTELASSCQLSPRQLARAFRASYGCSIGQYVDEVRMEQAKDLLLSSGPIKNVAYDLGFTNHQNFTFAFRRMTGVTPSEFRKRAAKRPIEA